MTTKQSYEFWEHTANKALTHLICSSAVRAFDIEVDDATRKKVSKALTRPKNPDNADLALPCFVFARATKEKAPVIAEKLAQAMSEETKDDASSVVASIASDGPYLNCFVSNGILTGAVDAIVDGGFLEPLESAEKEKVMIEYSQPNTHKAFHVGHMRNAALGDSLVRLYEYQGHKVVAANYFGDEGAHVAKCLWYLRKYWLNQGHKLDEIAAEDRGEFLGGCYSKSVAMLDLSSMTSLPYHGLVAAEVLEITGHPSADAPKNWHVVRVRVGGDGDDANECTVVCGGEGYNVGDKVAYAPLNLRFNNKMIIPKDMKGVVSEGVMVAYREVGVAPPPLPPKDDQKSSPQQQQQSPPADEEKATSDGGGGGKKKKKKKKKKGGGGGGQKDKGSNRIYILPADIKVGEALVDYGRIVDSSVVNNDVLVSEEYTRRLQEVADTLAKLEDRSDDELSALWDTTKEWSLTDFRSIYQWLDVRFDHEFFESEVSEESKSMVEAYEHCDENKEHQVLVRSNGALGADLTKYKLGFCMVLKSNGAGLYATKDLALAKRKFNQFEIEKSVYVIDAAQSLHCQQVFKVLELMGFEQAKQCFHLAYGQVVLPSGKMSSRTGTVILFSALRDQLYRQIHADYLQKYEPSVDPNSGWTREDIDHARRAISLATIKYGMLSVSPSSDIIFEMDKWTAKSGNTGPYIMYTYARINKILRDIQPQDGAQVDYSVLQHPKEHAMLVSLNEARRVIADATYEYNPSRLTQYLFNLSQSTSAWYELPNMSVKHAEPNTQLTRLRFLTAIACVIKRSLNLLGIEVLDRM